MPLFAVVRNVDCERSSQSRAPILKMVLMSWSQKRLWLRPPTNNSNLTLLKHYNVQAALQMIRKALLRLLSIYQKFFTLIGYGSCRYYPTCSEYAKWQFEENPLYIAFYKSALRILSCNQLFPGGIDYPQKHCFCEKPVNKAEDLTINKIKFWLVPTENKKISIIKNFRFKG